MPTHHEHPDSSSDAPEASNDLEDRLARPGFTPGARDLVRLMDLLDHADDKVAKRTARAIAQTGSAGARLALSRFAASAPPARARILSALAQIALRTREAGLVSFLVERAHDSDRKTRQCALSTLGKLGSPEAVPVLTEALLHATTVLEKKTAAEALGRIGGQLELEALRPIARMPADGETQELVRVAGEAVLRIERTILRSQETSTIELQKAPLRPVRLLLHVRAGLESMLLTEIQSKIPSLSLDAAPERRPRKVGRGRVAIDFREPLANLFAARLFLHFGFPLPPVRTDDLDQGLVRALTSDPCLEILRTFTTGPIRYRIEWAGHGHRRSATYRAAEAVARSRPELVNDPRSATWEVVALHRANAVWVELWPRAFTDPRFQYRAEAVQGASHPTLAAALALQGGVRSDDVVWDPFAGAGVELIERAKLGPYRAIYGSDIAEAALRAARANLQSAQVHAHLFCGDARSDTPPEKVTLVITNPPMGRRVRAEGSVDPLLGSALANMRRAMTARGRIAWISPHPSRDLEHARQVGFVPEQRVRVDMGGFDAEMQLLRVADR